MKKKLLSVVLTAVMAASVLTGCGSTDNGTASTAAATGTAQSEAAATSAASTDGKVYNIGICQLIQHDALDAATKGFEDAFVDAQANVISLCLELLKNSEKSADVIYVYILQNDDEEYIDAFFEKDGKLFTTNDWCSDAQIKEFFHCGIEDIESIVELCDTYDAKCPHEFKLVYNVNSKSFDSNYNYENATDVYDKDVIELVEEWFNECEKKISH